MRKLLAIWWRRFLLAWLVQAAYAGGAEVPVPQAEELQRLIQAFAEYQALPPDEQAKAAKPACAVPPLSKADSENWRKALWKGWVQYLRTTRNKADPEPEAALASGKGSVQATLRLAPGRQTRWTMQYMLQRFGKKPERGWPLYINLHSGGDSKDTNDRCWAATRSQYPIQTGLYLCPRSVQDTAESWFEPSNYGLLGRLLAEAYAFWEVDPNRVYILGYSMGGWGTLHLGPSVPDLWAAVAASAGAGFVGATVRASADNLFNTPLMIQIGAKDMAFRRYTLSKAFAERVRTLHEKEPAGYLLSYKEHPGAGHQINDRDTPAWLAGFTRDPQPKKIVWQQPIPGPGNSKKEIDRLLETDFAYREYFRSRCYWLRNDHPGAYQRVVALREGNTFHLEQVKHLNGLTLLLDDRCCDLDRPVRVLAGEKVLAEQAVSRSAATLLATLVERGDPEMMAAAELQVKLPDFQAAWEGRELHSVPELLERAEYRQALDRLDEATQDLEAALKLDPKLGPEGLFAQLLQFATAQKDPARKLDLHRRWAEAAPNNAKVLGTYASECLNSPREDLRDPKVALDQAQKAVALGGSPESGLLSILALAFFRTGDPQKAVETQRRAIEALPPGLPTVVRSSMEKQLREFEAKLKQ